MIAREQFDDAVDEIATVDCWSEFDEIAADYDPPSRALTEMVRRIANRLELDVCSIYMLESDGRHLCLAATMGLNQSSVGRVRMEISEGLAGLVVETRETVEVESASEHPRFKYFPEAGEDRYTSFFGFPIADKTHNIPDGVLVVQTIEPRDFTVDEVTALQESASRLARYISRVRQVEFSAAP